MPGKEKPSKADLKAKLITSFIAACVGVTSATFQIAPILTDEEGTTNALIAEGYQPVDVGGGVWLGGEAGDLWRTRFTAENPQGLLVSGYATDGFFKGVTLRDIKPITPEPN